METNKPAICPAVWFSGFFGLGAVVHLIRLLLHVPVRIGTFDVPLTASVILVLVFGGLSAGLLYLAMRRPFCEEKGSCGGACH